MPEFMDEGAIDEAPVRRIIDSDMVVPTPVAAPSIDMAAAIEFVFDDFDFQEVKVFIRHMIDNFVDLLLFYIDTRLDFQLVYTNVDESCIFWKRASM